MNICLHCRNKWMWYMLYYYIGQFLFVSIDFSSHCFQAYQSFYNNIVFMPQWPIDKKLFKNEKKQTVCSLPKFWSLIKYVHIIVLGTRHSVCGTLCPRIKKDFHTRRNNPLNILEIFFSLQLCKTWSILKRFHFLFQFNTCSSKNWFFL